MNMFGKSDPKKAESKKRDVYNHRSHRETYGLNMKQLKDWSRVRLDLELTTEAAKQQIAVSRVRTFLDAIATVIRIQSWWRSRKLRRVFFTVVLERRERKRLYFRQLKIYWRSERMHSYQLFGKFFLAWREEMRDQQRLQTLIHTFFSLCIQRMRLSPQAVMAYFNPGEWSVNISSTDKMKIRRLLLQRLFAGWRAQSRDLKIVRYKASQILARMMRRTKGPMWVKESTLVCFHIWHRYIRVKRAYRRSEPDPRYTNPFLPQWTKLYKEITINRIKRKRSQEAGVLLTSKRAMRMWIHLMNVDRSKPVTPLAVAISHYNTVLMNKMMLCWYEYVRERGRNMRFRNKIFLIWKTWAPRHNKLRAKNSEAANWLRLSRQRKSFNAMISICLKVIGMRTEKIKEMRRNFCDRKLVIAAYGLMNMDEHVIMVDCWRRLAYYGRCKRNWKTLNWQYLFAWNQHKSKVLFHAWRDYTREQRAKRQLNMDYDDMKSIGSSESMLQDGEEHILPIDETGERYRRDMYVGFINDSTELFVKARGSQLPSELSSEQFHFFCSVLSQSHKRLPQMEKFDFDDLALYPPGQDNYFNNPGDRIPASLLHHFGDMSVGTATTMATASPHDHDFANDPVEKNKRKSFYQQIWNSERQLRIQKGVDEANLPSTLDQLTEGAVYDAQSLHQLSMHVGDQFLPLFCLLMMGSAAFLAERVVKGDKNKVINNCHHPIAALFAANQISRWELQYLTTREFGALTQDPLMLDSTGGRFRAIYFWRNVVLQLLDAKAELAAQTCVTLSENRTVEQEVAEVMKRNRIEKMIHLRYSISQSLGQNSPWTVIDRINQIIPPLVKYTIVKQTIDLMSLVDGREDALRHNKNIYHILREYTFLTGKLANEAKAIRSPLVERDKILSVNGFLKQARQEFLQLRKERMSKADREEEEEKREREEAKAKKLKDKEYAKIKKARNKKKAKRKKRMKKGKKKRGGRNSNTDAEDSDSVDSDASSISSNYSSYDERDGENSSQALLRDMFSNLGMTEEKEIILEKVFQHRVAYCGNNIFAETWQPSYWKQDIEVRKRHRQRLVMELRCCLRRLLNVVQEDSSIGQLNYEEIKSEYGGISMFIVDKTLAAYNQGLPQLWGALPKDYWRFSAVRDRMTRELAMMNAFMVGLKATYMDRKSKNRGMDKAVEEYQKFLKKARKEIIAIAEKQRQKEGEDTTLIQDKINAVKTAESRLAALKRGIKTKAEKMKIAVMLLESHNYTAVSDLLVKKPEPVEGEKRGKAKANDVIVTQDIAKELVDQGYAQLAEMEGKLAAAVEKTIKAHEVLDNSEILRKRMNKFLRSHAEERFNFMVDIQELVVRTSKALDAGEDGQEAMQRNRKTQIKYARSLQQFFDEFVVVRGQQLTKENESRRFQEMMHRPPSDSKVFAGTTKAQSRVAQLAMNDEDGSSGFSTPKMQTSRPNTRQAITEEDNESLEPKHFDFHDDDEPPSTLNARSRSEINMEVDQAASSIVHDTNFGIDPVRHMSKRGSQVNFDDGENGVSAANIQRSVDEQLELLHYNSPENIRKREEELQYAIDRQAKEKRLNDMRLKTFDDYWLSYPRRESSDLATTPARNKRNKKNDKHVHEEAVVESADDFFRTNRTRRMWKIIGKAYWRDKEANIRNLLDQGVDMTGLNPDDINMIKLGKREETDPLDLEMNLVEDPAEVEAQRQAAEAKRLAMIEPTLLVDSFTELGEELWKSPNKVKQILVKTSVSNKEIHEASQQASRAGSVAPSQVQPVVRKPSSGSIGEDSVGSVKSHRSGASGETHVEAVAIERGVVFDPIVQAGRTSYKTNKATFISRALHAQERIDRTFNADYRLGADGNLLSSRSFDNSVSPNTRGIVPSAGLLHMASDVDLKEGMEEDDDEQDGKEGDDLSTQAGENISHSSSVDHQRQVAEYMRNLENVSPLPMVDTTPTLPTMPTPIIEEKVAEVRAIIEEVSIPRISSHDDEEDKEAHVDDNHSQEAASTTTASTSLKLSETGIEDIMRGKIRRQRKLRQSFQASTGTDVLTATKRLMSQPTAQSKMQEAISKAKETLLGNRPDSREGQPVAAGVLRKQMSSRLRMSVAAVMDSHTAAAHSKPLDGIAEAAATNHPSKSASIHMGMLSAAAIDGSGPKDMSDIVAQALQKVRALNEDAEGAAAAAAWNALHEVQEKHRNASMSFEPIQASDFPVAEIEEEETSVTSGDLTGSFAYSASAPQIAAKIAANRKLSMTLSEAAVLAETSRASTSDAPRKKSSLKVVINGESNEQPIRQINSPSRQLRFSLEAAGDQSPLFLSETSSMHREHISPMNKPGSGRLSSRSGSALPASAEKASDASKPSSANKINPRTITPLRKRSARHTLGISVVSTPGSLNISEGSQELRTPDSLFPGLSQDGSFGAFTDGDSTDMITANTDNEMNLASVEEDLPLVAQLGFLPDGTLGVDGGEVEWDYSSLLDDLPSILKETIHSPGTNADGIASRECTAGSSRPPTTDIKELIDALQSDDTGLGVPPPYYPNAVKFNYYPSNFRQNDPNFDEEPSHWEDTHKQDRCLKRKVQPASIQQQGDEAFPSEHEGSVLLPPGMKIGSLAIGGGNGSGGNSAMGSKAPTPTHFNNLQVSSIRASISIRNSLYGATRRSPSFARGGHNLRHGSVTRAQSISDGTMLSSRMMIHSASKDENDNVSIAVFAPREYTAGDDLEYCEVSFGGNSSVSPSRRQSMETGYDTEGTTYEERRAMEAAIALVQGHQQKLQVKLHPSSSTISAKANEDYAKVTLSNHDQGIVISDKLASPMYEKTKKEPHISPYHIRKREAIAKQLADLLADTAVEDETIQHFVDQAARIVHAREEGMHEPRTSMSPPVGGRLLTKELHFRHIQEAEDLMENFYDQLALIPPPGSPETQRHFVHPRPQSSRRTTTDNTNNTNNTNTARDSNYAEYDITEEDRDEPQVLVKRAGTPDFWIDVTANRSHASSFRHASPLLSPIASEGGRGITPELMPAKPISDENKNSKNEEKLITLPGRTLLEDLQTDPQELFVQPIAHFASVSLPPIGDTERKHMEHTRQKQVEHERHASRIEAARQQRAESGLLDPLQRAELQLQSNLATGGEKNPAPFLKISHSLSSLPPHQSSSKTSLSFNKSSKLGKTKKRPWLLQPLALSKGESVFSSSMNHLPANWKIDLHEDDNNFLNTVGKEKEPLEVLAVPPSSRQIIRDIAGSDYASTGRASLEIPSLTTGRTVFQQGPRSRGGISSRGKDGGVNSYYSISSSFASLTAPTAIKAALESVTNSEAFAVTAAEPLHMQQQPPVFTDELAQSRPDTGRGQGQQVLPPVVVSRRRTPQQRSMMRDSLQTNFDSGFVVRNSFGTALLTAEDLMSDEEKITLQQQRVLLDAIAAANEAYYSRQQTPDGRNAASQVAKEEDYEADMEAEMRILFNKPPTPKVVKQLTVTAVDLNFDDQSAARFDTGITEKSVSKTGGSMISSNAAVSSASPSSLKQQTREKPHAMKRNPTVKILAPMPYEGDNLLAKAQLRHGADLDSLSETSSIRTIPQLQHKALAGRKKTESSRKKV